MPGPPSNSIPWKLEIKNEYGNDDQIVLRSGRYTRITFILSPEDGQKYLDYSQLNSKFKIYLSDKNIKTDEDEYEINLAKSLEYSAYIGLKCKNNISELNYKIQFLIKDSNNMQIELNISPVTVVIDKTPTKIKLIPVKTYLPEKSYSFFKLGEELYNINELQIIQQNKEDNENYFFTNVDIKEYDTDNDSSKKRFFNGEILLPDYHYGISTSYENLGNETEYIFELGLSADNEEDKECFLLDENYQKLTIKALNETPTILNDLTKEAIVYSFENITPKKDESINIQIKLNIPVAPIFLTCELNAKKDDDTLLYQKYIYETGEQIFKFDNLKINAEYNIKCKFEDINNEKDEKSSFYILIGNKPGNDIITKIISSKDINRTPQCAIFTFGVNSTIDDLKEFEKLSEKYCYYIMNEKETIMNRIMENIKCESDKIDDEDDDDDNKENIRNKYMVCAGPSDENYDKKYKRNTNINFNAGFEKLIENLSNNVKINESLGISGLEVESLERYYDNEPPNINKIEIIKLKGKNDNKLKFNITSTNSQPIKCYYNEELNSNNNKKFISLEIDDVVLNEGETKKIETKIMDQPEEGAMLSLFMICYNLPGFSIKYESTGIFTAFTYYYSTTGEEDDNDETSPKKDDISIDCKEENNRGHPYCLKDRSNHIIDKIKTKMPDFIEDIMEKSDLFEKLPSSSQLKFLENSKKELINSLQKMVQNGENKENRKEVVEKLTELAEYLHKRDCSLYENDIEYKECRNKKIEILTDLITAVQSYFKCSTMIKIIKEGMTDDIEENLKYILFLISEITNNADSLKKGESAILYNITLCLQENFEEYWNNVQNSLEEKSSLPETIKSIKKDISLILIKSLNNLINILHYDEVDGYIKNDDISKAGIMKNSEGKKIQKGIFDFIKNFNDFGNGIYNISDKMKISVIINDENKEKNNIRTRVLLEEQLNEENDGEQIYNVFDKGIYIILHPKKMMEKRGGHAIQLVIYDSPLIPIENKKIKNVRDFISITIYDKNGKEIDITDLSEEERPIILYNKTLYKKLRHCFYYDEKKEELDTNGIVSKDNYVYRNEKYFRCSSKHLTSFTAGDYISSNSSNWWKVFLIILACLIILAIAAFVFIHFRKNKVDNKSIEKDFPNNEGMISV